MSGRGKLASRLLLGSQPNGQWGHLTPCDFYSAFPGRGPGERGSK